MLIAIETSCDETALAIFDINRFLAGHRRRDDLLVSEIVSSQLKLHEPYGGVVPELAAREHLVNLPLLFEEALVRAKLTSKDLSAVAVTCGPGLNGCLLVGLSFSKAFALGRGLPLFGMNHLEGHLFAAELEEEIRGYEFPALALLVSGGHTELVSLKGYRKYEIVARTRDDAVGEAFDKCATLLGLPYPGGPALSEIAAQGTPGRFTFPKGMADRDDAFSFSGVKTAVQREVTQFKDSTDDAALDEAGRADFAYAVQEALVEALVDKSSAAIVKHRPKTFVLTGGVAANVALRERIRSLCERRGVELRIPERRWCTDNAAMIAMAAARHIEKAGWERGFRSALGALPRWPLEELSVS